MSHMIALIAEPELSLTTLQAAVNGARPRPPPGRSRALPTMQHNTVSDELANQAPANRPSGPRGYVLNPM